MRLLLSKRQRVLAVVAGAALVGVFLSGLYENWQERVVLLEAQIESRTKELGRNLETIEATRKMSEDYSEHLRAFEQTSSDEEVMSSLLSEIRKAADKISMHIADIKPERVKKEALYNNFSVRMSLEGSYEEIVRFIYILQDTPYAFAVDELRLSKNSPRSQNVDCELGISKMLVRK
jgi:Tfp pilus assembly protein PilO